MEISDQNIALIEKFFAGNLTGEESAAFEARREAEPEFDREVMLYAQARENIDILGDMNLKAHFKQRYEATEARVIAPVWIRFRYAIAAAVLLLIGSVILLNILPDSKMAPEELYAMHFVPEEVSFTRSGSDPGEGVEQMIDLFNSQQYAQASILADSLLLNSSLQQSSFLLLYQGISRMVQEEFLSARESLGEIPDTSPYYWQAQWYMALTFLKTGETENAREILALLTEKSKEFGRKSQEILNHLDKD